MLQLFQVYKRYDPINMLHQRKYITNTIIPEEGVPVSKLGKKMFPENKAVCLKLDHSNAGVNGERIGELNINSRKHISYIKSDSSQMKNSLNHCEDNELTVYPSKKPLVSYSCYENQAKYFETKLVPDCHGRMSICVGRKSGSATVNMNVDDYDLEKTYHTWKKIIEKSNPHTRSNLENDRFLTVAEDAKRYDRLPVVNNRNPPVANPDGPFESDRLNLPKQARDNLDRTLTPRVNSQKYDHSKRVAINYKNTFPLSQPHAYPSIDQVRGVKRNVSHWAHADRVRKILYNYSDNDSEDVHGYEHPFIENNSSKQGFNVGCDEQSCKKADEPISEVYNRRQPNEQQNRLSQFQPGQENPKQYQS